MKSLQKKPSKTSYYFWYGIRIWLMINQFIAVFSQLDSSGDSVWSTEERKVQPDGPAFYIIGIISALIAIVAAITVNKFQGPLITEEVENKFQDSMLDPASIGDVSDEEDEENGESIGTSTVVENSNAVNNPTDVNNSYARKKSRLVELSYLVLAAVRELAENCIIAAGSKAWILQFISDSKLVIAPLSLGEFLGVSAYTLLVDFPFNATNGVYKTAKSIKKEISGSKKDALIDKLCLPLAKTKKIGIWYTKYLGSFSHSANHCIGLIILLAPPEALKTVLDYSPTLFTLLIIGEASLITFLGVPNIAQTIFFEGYESERNLRKLLQKNSEATILIKNKKAKFPSINPCFHKPLYIGIKTTQALLHAFEGLVAPSLFAQHWLNDQSLWVKAGTVAALAVVQVPGTAIAIQKSEVRKSLEEMDDMINAKDEAYVRERSSQNW